MSEDGNFSAVKDNAYYAPHNIIIKSMDFCQNHENNLENLLTENDAYGCLNKSEKIEFKKEFIEKSGNKIGFSDQNQNNEIMEVEKDRMRLTPSFFNNQQKTVNYIILIIIIDTNFKENWFFYFHVKKKNTQYNRQPR